MRTRGEGVKKKSLNFAQFIRPIICGWSLEDVVVHLPPDVLEPLHDADRHREEQREDYVADGD